MSNRTLPNNVYTQLNVAGNFMNRDKVIFENKPRRLKSSLNRALIISLVIGIFLFIGLDNLLLALLIPSAFLILLLLLDYFEMNASNGWVISNGEIELLKNTLFGQIRANVKLSDIKKITYSERQPRKPRYLILETSKEKYRVYCEQVIFKLADTLKYFKNRGIVIEFQYKDHEIELYLDNKIDKIPMRNI